MAKSDVHFLRLLFQIGPPTFKYQTVGGLLL